MWLLPVAGGLLVCMLVGWYRSELSLVDPSVRNPSLEGIVLGDLEDLRSTLGLYGHQFENMRRVLQGADQEYLELELRHTIRKVS